MKFVKIVWFGLAGVSAWFCLSDLPVKLGARYALAVQEEMKWERQRRWDEAEKRYKETKD